MDDTIDIFGEPLVQKLILQEAQWCRIAFEISTEVMAITFHQHMCCGCCVLVCV